MKARWKNMTTRDIPILRPPYLYGPMQNVYREPFVFECAEAGRRFYIPGDGSMKLQFFHVEDRAGLSRSCLEHTPQSISTMWATPML